MKNVLDVPEQYENIGFNFYGYNELRVKIRDVGNKLQSLEGLIGFPKKFLKSLRIQSKYVIVSDEILKDVFSDLSSDFEGFRKQVLNVPEIVFEDKFSYNAVMNCSKKMFGFSLRRGFSFETGNGRKKFYFVQERISKRGKLIRNHSLQDSSGRKISGNILNYDFSEN